MNITEITYWFKDFGNELSTREDTLVSNGAIIPPLGAYVYRYGNSYKVVDVSLFLDGGYCDVFLEQQQ